MRREQSEREAWAVFARDLGERLRDVRLARRLTQAQVVEAAQLSLYSLQTYENGVTARGHATNPTLANIMAIAQALDTPLWELLPTAPRLVTS